MIAHSSSITRESSSSVLRAFARERDPRARAALYAREIRPRLNEGDDLPLMAADVTDANLGFLSGTLVTQRTLELFKFQLPWLRRITTDFTDQPAQYGQTIATRIIVIPAVETYDTTNGWVQNTAPKTTDATVAINAHKGVPIEFNANTLASSVRRLFDEQGPASAYALAKDIVDALYAVITAANFADNAPFAEAEIDFGRKTFAKAARILNLQGAPMTDRFALINSLYYEKLIQDPTLVSLAVFQKPEIIENAELPAISKFIPYEAPNLPTTGNLAVFFAHRSALIVASRVPNDYSSVLPGASYGSVTTVTDPDIGISVQLVQYVNHTLGRAISRIALMYGVAKGNTKGGQIVTSQ